MDPDALASVFVEHYYVTFDTNRAALGGFYHDTSMLTFEGDKIQGATAIVAKLTSLPVQCAHAISTVDCQPSGPAGGVLVFVSGSLQLGGWVHRLKFSQMFQLMPTPQGSFYVLNDIFRLLSCPPLFNRLFCRIGAWLYAIQPLPGFSHDLFDYAL